MRRIPYTHLIKAPIRSVWGKILLLGLAYLLLQGLIAAGPTWDVPILNPDKSSIPCTSLPDMEADLWFQHG